MKMTKWSSGLVSLSALAAFLGGAIYPAQAVSTDDGSAGIEHQIDVRTEFGLRHDTAYVESLQGLSGLTKTSLGIPLTSQETSNIEGRDRLDAVLGRIDEVAGDSPLFAGVSIDQAAGGAIKLAFTRDPGADATTAALAATLKRLVPSGTEVEISTAATSQAALKSAYDSLTKAWASGAIDSVQITSITQSPTNLEVSITGGDAAAVQSTLRDKYGWNFLTVQRTEPVQFQAR